jgi:NAD/NADP transhydrogenase beta subunit
MLTGVISVFMIIISGLRYITSGGDATKTATARKGIMYAAIGVAVAMSAGIIAQFVIGKV